MIITSMSPSLYELQHMQIISDEYEAAPNEYKQLFHEVDARAKTETIPHIGAFGAWAEGTEGGVLPSDEIVEGDTATFSLKIYNKSYDITYEARKWDQYNKMTGKAQELVRGLNYTIESEAASVLNKGFATTTGYDGSYLFSNTHDLVSSTSSGDNLFTGAINYANIKAGELLLRNTVNEANLPIFCRPDTLWCAIDKHRDALEIVSSSNIPGEISNTKASLPPLTVTPMSLLTAGYWGLKDSRYAANNLIMMWFDRPMFKSEMVPGSWEVMKVKGYTAFQPGYADWRGIVGSVG